MKWKNALGFLLFQCLLTNSLFSQKKIGEFTAVYNSSVENATSKTGPVSTGTTTVFIKGNMSRSEISTALALFVTIYDATTNSGVVLREVNGQKLLIRMNGENWQDRNKRYNGIHFTNTSETKTIAGYKCIKAIGHTPDNLNVSVFYTRDLLPDNHDFLPEFKGLEGLPLEFQLSRGTTVISYSLASINLNPVPASKFDIPKGGYREMTYEESKKLNSGGQ